MEKDNNCDLFIKKCVFLLILIIITIGSSVIYKELNNLLILIIIGFIILYLIIIIIIYLVYKFKKRLDKEMNKSELEYLKLTYNGIGFLIAIFIFLTTQFIEFLKYDKNLYEKIGYCIYPTLIIFYLFITYSYFKEQKKIYDFLNKKDN